MENATGARCEKYFVFPFTLLPTLVTVLVLVLVGRRLTESDTLWHIKAGEWIAENGIPYTDPFSWTMRGEEWFAHEWLWELIAAKVHGFTGPAGIWLFTCLWVALFGFALWNLLVQRCSLPRAALIYSFVMLSSFFYWNARPHTMAHTLFALTVLVLLNARAKPKLLMSLPFITLLWANVHGSAPLGVITAALFWLITTGRLQSLLPNLSVEILPGETRKLLGIVTMASFISTLVNPHGINLWYYMWSASRHPLITNFIMEWKSPDFHEPAFWPVAVMVLSLLFIFVLKGISPKNKVPLIEFLLACGFFFLVLQQKRHAPYFYFSSALVTATMLGHGGVPFPRLNIKLKSLIAAIILSAFTMLAWLNPPTWIDDGRYFPEAATDYLLQMQNGDSRRLFNQYDYGGYLIWRGLSPFIDGRADMYAFKSEVFKDYLLITRGYTLPGEYETKPPQYYLDKYGIDTVMIQSGCRLDLYLVNHPGWRLEFKDEKTVIYVREKS